MSVQSAATELRRQAIALRNGHAGTQRAVADGLLRLADSLADLERLADDLNEAWAVLRQVPGGRGHLADACLEAARLLRPVAKERDRG